MIFNNEAAINVPSAARIIYPLRTEGHIGPSRRCSPPNQCGRARSPIRALLPCHPNGPFPSRPFSRLATNCTTIAPAERAAPQPFMQGKRSAARAPSSLVARRSRAVAGGIGIFWAAGVLIGLGRIAVGWRRVATRSRRGRSTPCGTLPHWRRSATRWAIPLPPIGVARAHRAVRAGLPARCVIHHGDSPKASRPELRDVLVHECAHLLRRDPRMGLLQRSSPHSIGRIRWSTTSTVSSPAPARRSATTTCCGPATPADTRTLLALTERCRPPAHLAADLGLLAARWTLADASPGCSTREGSR